MSHWSERLKQLQFDDEVVVWARDYKTMHDAWLACQRGDWMVRLLTMGAHHDEQVHKKLVLCMCDLLDWLKPQFDCRHEVTDFARQWANGEDEPYGVDWLLDESWNVLVYRSEYERRYALVGGVVRLGRARFSVVQDRIVEAEKLSELLEGVRPRAQLYEDLHILRIGLIVARCVALAGASPNTVVFEFANEEHPWVSRSLRLALVADIVRKRFPFPAEVEEGA